VDIGQEVRQIVAGIRAFYTKEELAGKNVVVIKNLAPAVIRGVESNGMLLATRDENGLAVLSTDRPMNIGSPVS
jgi:methionyl-tRNA synthetase